MIYKIAITLVISLVVFMFYKNSVTPSYIGMDGSDFSPMPSTPNAVSTQTDDIEKMVEPLPYLSIDDAKKKVKRVLAELPENLVESEQEKYMHIVFTTATMKYKDDVELYFDESKNVIQYRSQSRVGFSDKGLNRARYERFAELYSKLD